MAEHNPETGEVIETLTQKLSAPFPPDVITWRVGPTNQDKTRGQALAYIDARDVQDRLDKVCGVYWQTRHHSCGGALLACDIGIKVGDEWLWRGDGAGEVEGEKRDQDMAQKAAFSDAFKRAAVRWGIGRYLYDLDSPWIEIEKRGRSYAIAPSAKPRLLALLSGKPQPVENAAEIMKQRLLARTAAKAPTEPVDDQLIPVAQQKAADGWDALRGWYMGLTDEDRLTLRPAIKELQEAARLADDQRRLGERLNGEAS